MPGTTTDTSHDELLAERRGVLGRVTLNRPKAINALTLGMIREIQRLLDAWQDDDAVHVILLDGAGERGFCAGGDIKALWSSARTDPSFASGYWREEYELNARLARYPKPIVAIMDGVVMGGGVGLAGHVSHRVATERLRLAMPEVGIGFVPDVGGTWLLSRAPDEIGTWLALTGTHVGAHDALLAGFCDAVVEHQHVDALVDLLAKGARPDDAIDAVGAVNAVDEDVSTLVQQRGWIADAFARDSVEEIVDGLHGRAVPEARGTADTIETRSPTSLVVTLRALREARDLPSLEACLDQEFRIANRFLVPDGDFAEGVRAAVIDKDRRPRWDPGSVTHVDPATVDRYFAPLVDVPELGLAGA